MDRVIEIVRLGRSLPWALCVAILAVTITMGVELAVGLDRIRISGSGGLGAVSFGVTEPILEVGFPVFALVFIWRLRKTRSRPARTSI